MPVVVPQVGLLPTLGLLRASWDNTLRAGLFSNEITPTIATRLSQLVVCTFGGYVGLRSVQSWSVPAMVGPRATMQATTIPWVCDGTPPDERVWGAYVLDVAGNLIWVELLPGGPQLMRLPGDTVTWQPQFSLRSEF